MRLTEFAAQLSSSPVIICLVIQLVKCVQCADYRTFDVGDGLRQIPKQDSIPSGLTLPQAQFASRTGSLDIRSRYWSKTRRDEYPEEQEDDPYYSAPSQTDGEDYAQGQSEFHTSEPHVTVDREDNEHTVTINMPRMERTGGGDHMIKKFVIQPVIQYVVQYDKRAQREPREDMSGTQYEEYEGVEGQERLRSDHEGRVDRLFNDVNTNFDGYWGNDEHGGGNNGGGNNYQDFQNGDNTGANFGNDFGGNNAWSAINQQNQAPGVDAYVSWGHDKNNNNNNNNNPGAPSSSFVPSSRGDGTNGMSLSDAVQVSNAQQQQQPGRPPSRQDDGGMSGNQMGMMEENQMDVMGGQGGSMMGESMSNAMPQNQGYAQNTEGMGTSMNYGPAPQPRPTYGPPGMIPGEPMGETPPQMMMPMQSAPQMPMQMQPAPQTPIYQAPQMPMSTAHPMPIYQAPQMPMPTIPPMPIYQAPQMPMSTAPPMPLYQAPQMSMSTVPQMQMHVPQPQQMIQAPQPHPQVKEISASVNFGVSNYGPPPPPSSNYGPPAPPPPSNYGPPAPQPPSNYGPPAPPPPSNYGPPAAQPASNYGPPAPQQPPSNYGPPSHSQPSPTYGPPETTSQQPTSNAAETEGYGSTSKPTQTDSGGGYNEGGYGPEEHPKGWKGRKPGHDGRRPKRPRGGKGFMHSIRSLPKLPASIGGHLSFMFSTGFGKGRRGRGKPGGGWDGKNGSNKTSIDKEQVSDHILNILGLTVNHPREHSLNISENSTNPMLMWEQLGNQSSLDHLSQLLPIILVQGGTPEDTKTTTLLPATETTDVEDKVASGSSSSSTAAFITNNQTDVVIMEPETVHNDSIVTTATVNSVTQSNQVPLTASLNEAERQVRITLSFNSSTSTTTQLPLMTTTIQPEPQLLPSVPPTLITTTTTTNFPPPYFSPSSILPPLTTMKSPLSRVNTSTIPLPLTIKNYQTLYPLPPRPRQGRIQRPPTTPSPQKQLFPMRNTSPPPPHFPTPYDPVQENININLSNNILHLEEPYMPPKNSSITKANILAYYTEPSFGDPTLIKFDPLIYDALQAAFRNDNTYYFHDGITRKRKRSRLHIPSHNIDVRSRSNFDKLRRVLRKN